MCQQGVLGAIFLAGFGFPPDAFTILLGLPTHLIQAAIDFLACKTHFLAPKTAFVRCKTDFKQPSTGQTMPLTKIDDPPLLN